MSSEDLQKVIEIFDKEIDNYKQTGEPIVFGRLEGIKDVAEAMGWDSVIKHIESRAKELVEE